MIEQELKSIAQALTALAADVRIIAEHVSRSQGPMPQSQGPMPQSQGPMPQSQGPMPRVDAGYTAQVNAELQRISQLVPDGRARIYGFIQALGLTNLATATTDQINIVLQQARGLLPPGA